MVILGGFVSIFAGVFLVWLGAFQIITNMVPHDVGISIAEQHGAWMREHIFRLPPIKEQSDGQAQEHRGE